MENRLKSYLTAVVIIFLFLGMVYCSAFFSHFGIAFWNFFSLEDYLKGSLHAIGGLLLGLLGGVYFAHFDSKIKDFIKLSDGKEVPKQETDSKSLEELFKDISSLRHLKDHKTHVVFLVLAIMLTVILTYVYKSPLRYFFFSLSLLFIIYLAVDIYFKTRITFYLLLNGKSRDFTTSIMNIIDLTIVTIFLTIGISLTNADLIKSGQIRSNLRISLNPPITIAQDNLVLIGAARDYFFFFDQARKVAIVIPRKDLLLLEQSTNEDNFTVSFKALFGKY